MEKYQAVMLEDCEEDEVWSQLKSAIKDGDDGFLGNYTLHSLLPAGARIWPFSSHTEKQNNQVNNDLFRVDTAYLYVEQYYLDGEIYISWHINHHNVTHQYMWWY